MTDTNDSNTAPFTHEEAIAALINALARVDNVLSMITPLIVDRDDPAPAAIRAMVIGARAEIYMALAAVDERDRGLLDADPDPAANRRQAEAMSEFMASLIPADAPVN